MGLQVGWLRNSPTYIKESGTAGCIINLDSHFLFHLTLFGWFWVGGPIAILFDIKFMHKKAYKSFELRAELITSTTRKFHITEIQLEPNPLSFMFGIFVFVF